MKTILILKGCPASGKTTFAREFVKTNKNYVIVSRDSIRESRGEYWIPEQESYISEIEEFSIKSALNNNLNVIIDATNLNQKTLDKWYKIAKEFDCEVEEKLFYIDFKTALERDKNRERSVGEKVLKQFYRNYFKDEFNKETGIVDNRFILKQDTSLVQAIIVDVDGTLALTNGRSHYDYSKVLTDKPNSPVIDIVNILSTSKKVIIVSGRKDSCKEDTETWLKNNGIKYDEIHMRKSGDYRKDNIIKSEIYNNHIKDKYYISCVFDDRDQVCKQWRDLGLLCNQVYYGEF